MEQNRFIVSAFSDEAGSALEAQIAALKRCGIPGMEIRGVDGVNIADLRPEEVRAIKDRLDAEGLRVWHLASPLGKSQITAPVQTELDRLKRLLESAQILGARAIRMFSFYLPDGNLERWHDEVMERLSLFADTAKGSGVLLCHENERGIYGERAPECLEIMRCVPRIRCVFDPANLVVGGNDAWRAWEMLRDHVDYLHIKDALPDGTIVPAGAGVGRVPDMIREYAGRGGKYLTLEPHLAVFAGLSDLELENSALRVDQAYRSQDEAFDAAWKALHNIISGGNIA